MPVIVLKGNMEVDTVGIQGPTGPTGPKGDPAFLQFSIDTNGNLILEQDSSNYQFQIIDKELVVNF